MDVYTLSGKPIWACVMYGMYSSRKYCIKRHISNSHNGVGNIASFIDYIASRRQGIYFPKPISNYLIKENQTVTPEIRPLDVIKTSYFEQHLERALITVIGTLAIGILKLIHILFYPDSFFERTLFSYYLKYHISFSFVNIHLQNDYLLPNS
jgi:hypothetical protein